MIPCTSLMETAVRTSDVLVAQTSPADFCTHDSIPETLMQEGNKSRVSGVGVESNRPTINFPGISVDTNRFDCLVEKSGLGVAP